MTSRLLRKLSEIELFNITLAGLDKYVLKQKKLLDSFEVDWTGAPNCGSNGCILPTHDPYRVIKITLDPAEVKLFVLIQQEEIHAGFVDVDFISEGSRWSIIVKERVVPLLLHNDDVLTNDYVNFMHVYYQEMNDVSQKRKSLPSAISFLRKHTFSKVVDIFISLRKFAYKGYRLLDIDLDNVGLNDDGQLVIFDAQLEML